MVVTSKPNWARILRQIASPLTVIVVIGLAAAIVNAIDHPFKAIAIPDMTVSLLGAALSIFLGFRTNSAYDRWWEARKLWGGLVNSSRSLARQAISFIQAPSRDEQHEAEGQARMLVYQQIAFVHALRLALRKQEPWQELSRVLEPSTISALELEKNVPAALLQKMGETASKLARGGLLSELQVQRLDSTFTDLSNIQGGCERIKNTPLPRQYDFYPELLVKVYCTVLPLVLVEELKWFTPVVTALVGSAFLILNRVGRNLEDPFENTVYDTPMTALSFTIETNLRQALGETQLPEPVTPVRGVLW
ncbi:MAG: bestrophin family protein [Bryobacteraceae bacterium]